MKVQAFLLVFFAGTVALYGQSPKTLGQSCATRTGSSDVSGVIGTLNTKFTSDNPDVAAALSTCQSKLQELKDKEDNLWNSAIKDRDSGSCAGARNKFLELSGSKNPYSVRARDEAQKLNTCTQSAPPSSSAGGGVCSDASTYLRNADGAERTKEFDRARTYLLPVQNCPGSAGDQAKAALDRVDRERAMVDLESKIDLALRQKDRDGACRSIAQVESKDPGYPKLAAWKQAAACPSAPPPQAPAVAVNVPKPGGGGKPEPAPPIKPPDTPRPADTTPATPPPVDHFKEQLDSAKGLLEENRPKDAEPILIALRREDRGNKEVQELLKRAQDEIARNGKLSEEDLIRKSNSFLAQGDFAAAANVLAQARSDSAGIQKAKQDVEVAKGRENDELLVAIDAYYKGDYGDSRKKLEDFLKKGHAGRIKALAQFYDGAAFANEYYLGDEASKKRAEEAFAKVLKLMPTFSSQMNWNAVPNKVRSLFLTAAGQQ